MPARRRLLAAPVLALLAGADAAAAQEPPHTTAEPIPDAIWAAMQGKSWHADRKCPGRDELVLLTVPYLDFDGARQTGQLIVAKAEGDRMARAFDAILAGGAFRIARMELVDAFGGDDDASMAANNTSAFNCRYVGGTTKLSEHAFGTAIDINPVQNPYVTRAGTYPPQGEAYDEAHERKGDVTGIILEGDPVTQAFKDAGWSWGGNWKTKKDFQHFSLTGN
jgi:poly-gamma-glutamate synthesis protein (capsule biosynthesis protein)